MLKEMTRILRMYVAPKLVRSLQNFLPAIREERVLDFVDDVNFLVLVIDRRAARSDDPGRFAPDGGFRRNVAAVGDIPDSDEGFSYIPRYLDARGFVRDNDFAAFRNTCETLQRVNAGVRTGDDLPRGDIAVVCPVKYENPLRGCVADSDHVVDGIH